MGSIQIRESAPIVFEHGDSLVMIYGARDCEDVRNAGRGLIDDLEQEPCLLVIDVTMAEVRYIARETLEQWIARA